MMMKWSRATSLRLFHPCDQPSIHLLWTLLVAQPLGCPLLSGAPRCAPKPRLLGRDERAWEWVELGAWGGGARGRGAGWVEHAPLYPSPIPPLRVHAGIMYACILAAQSPDEAARALTRCLAVDSGAAAAAVQRQRAKSVAWRAESCAGRCLLLVSCTDACILADVRLRARKEQGGPDKNDLLVGTCVDCGVR